MQVSVNHEKSKRKRGAKTRNVGCRHSLNSMRRVPDDSPKASSFFVFHYVICIKSSCRFYNVLRNFNFTKVSFIILRHCRTQWPCWLHTWGGASSLTKTLISQSTLCTFASAFTLVTLTLCVKCRRTVKGTLIHPLSPQTIHVSQFLALAPKADEVVPKYFIFFVEICKWLADLLIWISLQTSSILCAFLS